MDKETSNISSKLIEKSFENPIENNSGGLLALLWRKILADTKNISKRNSLIERAILENKIKHGSDDKSATSLKHRVKNYCESGKQSWQVFLLLLTKILKVHKLRITIEFEYNNTEFIVSQDIIVNTEEDLSSGLKSLDIDKKDDK